MELETLMQEEASNLTAICEDGQVAFDALPLGAPIIRHGDLLLKKATLPAGAKRLDSRSLLRSETTGHIHGVKGRAAIYEANDSLYVVVDGPAVMGLHLEHKDAALPVGTMSVTRKREGRSDYVRFVAD